MQNTLSHFSHSIIRPWRLILLSLFIILTGGSGQAQTPGRDFLQKEYKAKGGLSDADLKVWRQEKVNELKKALAALPEEEKKTIIRLADSALNTGWPVLKMSDYLKYKTADDLMAYHKPVSVRRARLTHLLFGELLSGNSGKYIGEIANGLWLTLEESTWVSPQHIFLQKAGDELPDPNEAIISLGSADVASLVAWTKLLLHDELKAISPMILAKVDSKLEREIFGPFLSRNDLHWLGFGTGKVNNWNIWINTNILIAAMCSVDDGLKREKIISKAVLSADQFLNKYPEDGGCDEGVTYWNEAGGRLIQFVSMLMEASGNKLDWSGNRLIHAMGTYIYKMHIGGSRYVNFADAFAENHPSPTAVYQFGKVFKDRQLKQFAAYLAQAEEARLRGSGAKYSDHNHFIKDLESRDAIHQEKALAPLLKENWLPDLQVLTLRGKSGTDRGLFFAAKGGHNAESHNHNDIGNFILYLDGEPGLVDAGVDTYTKVTFSKDRYTLWNMQSQWHNCPTINGVQQQNGRQYAPKDVQFSGGGKTQRFSLDIAGAYPAEAAVDSWKREFSFDGTKGILDLRENYQLRELNKPFELHFMTSMEVQVEKAGLLRISRNGKSIRISYNPEQFTLKLEDTPIATGRLQAIWGDKLQRISLVSKTKALTGSHSIRFSASPYPPGTNF